MAAASPISMQRAQGHQRRTSAPINVNMNHPQGQVPYRMSFSPSEREYQQQQQSAHHDPTYTGIVGGASRSIFGSDDENFMPNHPSPMDSRGGGGGGYNGDHQQQQYLAHERLASIAERTTPQNGPPSHHQNGQYTPLIPNRPSVPSFPLQLQTSVGSFSGGMTSSPIGAGPGDWATAMASKRA